MQARSSLEDDDRIVSGFGLEDDVDIRIGGNSFMAITNKKLVDGGFRQRIRTTSTRIMTNLELGEKFVAKSLDSSELSFLGRMGVRLLFFPLFAFQCILQARMFFILLVFNYTGFNFRPYALFYVATERDISIRHCIQKGAGLSVNKVNYLAERYMPVWINCVLFVISLIDFPALIGFIEAVFFISYTENGGDAFTVMLRFGLAILVGFGNLDPKKAARADISTFLSGFLGEEIAIRDSPHTRLKDLTEILNDIKQHNFAVFHTKIGSTIIVSTEEIEYLSQNPEFINLLNTNTFNNNQVLRFIQIEKDVDSFFVIRDDVGICNRAQTNNHRCGDRNELDISDFELSLYFAATIVSYLLGVLLVACFVQISSNSNGDDADETGTIVMLLFIFGRFLLNFLLVFAPFVYAFGFRNKKSKLASINFFTLDSKDRKYQPYNNVVVATDDAILKKIQNFKFFSAMFKFTRQSKFLLHSLLKCAENIKYDWINKGLQLKDFKRLAALAASIYEKDVGIITPNAKVYYKSPRHSSPTCVVFTALSTGVIKADLMVVDLFDRVAADLPEGPDDLFVENTFYN